MGIQFDNFGGSVTCLTTCFSVLISDNFRYLLLLIQFCNQSFSKYARKALDNFGPKVEPIAIPSTSLQDFPLKIK